MGLTRADSAEGNDPVPGQLLGFLARGIAHHPERLQAFGASLVQRIHSLVGGEVDLDAACWQTISEHVSTAEGVCPCNGVLVEMLLSRSEDFSATRTKRLARSRHGCSCI